jgi:hypothetical protein
MEARLKFITGMIIAVLAGMGILAGMTHAKLDAQAEQLEVLSEQVSYLVSEMNGETR